MMKSMFIFIGLISFLFLSLQNTTAGEASQTTPKLNQLWQIENQLEVPESVLCIPSANLFFVYNISGTPKEKNGKGFLSKVAMTGNMIKLKWATGLNAPKGMAIFGQRLYVSDIDRLVEIDLASGKTLAEFAAPGARFLNDVVADRAGIIYVSDSSSKNSVIYRLDGGKLSAWMSGKEIKKPNGLFMDKGRLLVGNSGDGCIKSIDLVSKKVDLIAKVGSGIDGLHPDGNGNYIVSDWKGRAALVTANGQVVTLLDTTAKKINAADLDYVIGQKMLLIPTFFDNRVVAYKAAL